MTRNAARGVPPAQPREMPKRREAAPRLGAVSLQVGAHPAAIYLFAALKMKLEMAARREHARLAGLPEPTGGA